ncbi:MAG: response regulator transcription factor [Armatimonadota bacterium]|nr:response regulator transcription factor [Armatimonadota bacterium]
MQTISILLVDDHTVMRAGLARLLSAEPDMEVVGEAPNGFEAIRRAIGMNPDVIVMDLSMPGIDGLEATRQIRAKLPDSRILALTMHEERRYLHQLLRAGASGYFLKRDEFSEFATAIRAVAHGQVAVSESMLQYLVPEEENASLSGEREEFDKLTDREKQVADLLVHGYTNKEIAERLMLSGKTVETHRANLFAKLHVRTRAELVRYAIRIGEFGETQH